MNLRLASPVEATEVYAALLRMLDYSPAPQMRLCEPEVARSFLRKAADEGRLWVYGDFALLIDTGSPWHTTKRLLIEEVIVRFRREHGNTVESAIAQLEVLARQLGCVAVAAGDTQVGYMAPRYHAAGYVTLGTQFYKETP